MAHLTLDELNLLFAQKATEQQRAQWSDHLIDCETCARQFKIMHALHEEMGEKRKQRAPLRYALGAAAVIFMCAYPYFTTPHQEGTTLASVESAAQNAPSGPVAPESSSFDLLNQVREVNYRKALEGWGQEHNLTDLIQLTKQ